MTLSIIILSLLALLLIIIAITMGTNLLVRVPSVPTPRAVSKRMVELAALKGNETVYDLGCGDGRILIEAKKRCPGIRAIGYEIALGTWIMALLRCFFSRVDVTVKLRDYSGADLSDADVIFLYLLPEIMPKVVKKFDAELRPGTRVISHGFHFEGKEPMCIERCPLNAWNIFKPRGKVGPRIFVYAW